MYSFMVNDVARDKKLVNFAVDGVFSNASGVFGDN